MAQYQYETSLQNRPPIQLGTAALSGLVASPYDLSYGSQHNDILRAKSAQNAANYAVDADKLNATYDLAQQQAQQGLVNQGLQVLAADKQQQDNLRQARMSAMQSFTNGVLGGLFS